MIHRLTAPVSGEDEERGEVVGFDTDARLGDHSLPFRNGDRGERIGGFDEGVESLRAGVR